MTDADKLRILADWHDVQDDKREFSGEREVQRDLRRIADALETRKAVDVEALVAKLRKDALRRENGLGEPDGPATEHHAADALEAQQAVVEAARIVCSNPLDVNLVGAICKAITALDAPKEGDG